MIVKSDLTARQLGFVKAYVKLGGMNATQAAIAAGYSGKGDRNGAAVAASRLLQRPVIIQAIREEVERTLRAGVALGASVLEQLAREGKSESVRLQAAQALLDRGGMQLASLSEHHVVVEDKRTDAELLNRVQELARELGVGTRVIPGELALSTTPRVTNPGYISVPVIDSEGLSCV